MTFKWINKGLSRGRIQVFEKSKYLNIWIQMSKEIKLWTNSSCCIKFLSISNSWTNSDWILKFFKNFFTRIHRIETYREYIIQSNKGQYRRLSKLISRIIYTPENHKRIFRLIFSRGRYKSRDSRVSISIEPSRDSRNL